MVGRSVGDELPGTGRYVGDELLTVHRSYLPGFQGLLDSNVVHGLAHVTGGGIPGNLPRVLPDGLGASIDRGSWRVPAVFRTLQDAGNVDRYEMDRVFNMGIGMLAVVSEGEVQAVVSAAAEHGIGSRVIGRIEPGGGVEYQ